MDPDITIIPCRCCGLCLSGDKELFKEYFDGDLNRFVYSEMLLDTFNISISLQKQNLICQDCIHKLIEAMTFKHQVMVTENHLINTIGTMMTEETKIKIEDIKKEKDERIPRYDDSRDDSMEHEDFSPASQNDENEKNTLNPNIEGDMRETSLKLIRNSNACLFVSQKTKFKCFYCKNSYTAMNKLREHATTHNNEAYLKNVFRNMGQFSTRSIDITNLKCILCETPCNTLEDLRIHLSTSHAVAFDSLDHLLVPYRLTVTEEFSCVICNEKYTTFHSLNRHMNIHSSGNVCDVCGMSFWSRIKLRMHIYSQHKTKKCNICSESFLTQALKVRHMMTSHQKGLPKRICPDCDEIFTYEHQLTEHRVIKHNLQRKIYKCKECNKEFIFSSNLNRHVRNVHRGVRKYSCELCRMSFSTKSDKTRHGKSHENEKPFSCNYCNCKFKSKDSMQRHSKKQHAHLQNESEIK